MAHTQPKTEPQIRVIKRQFAAPRTRVFAALTDAEELARWMGPPGTQAKKVKIDLRIGGRFSLELHGTEGGIYPASGSYLEITPPTRLVQTWIWGSGDYEGLETRMTFELSEVPGGTELTVIHENLADEKARELHNEGWTGTLDRLQQLFAA